MMTRKHPRGRVHRRPTSRTRSSSLNIARFPVLSSEQDDISQLVCIDVYPEHQNEHQRGQRKQSLQTLEESITVRCLFGPYFGLHCDMYGRRPSMSMLLSHIAGRYAYTRERSSACKFSKSHSVWQLVVALFYMAGRGRAEK